MGQGKAVWSGMNVESSRHLYIIIFSKRHMDLTLGYDSVTQLLCVR